MRKQNGMSWQSLSAVPEIYPAISQRREQHEHAATFNISAAAKRATTSDQPVKAGKFVIEPPKAII